MKTQISAFGRVTLSSTSGGENGRSRRGSAVTISDFGNVENVKQTISLACGGLEKVAILSTPGRRDWVF